jgi:lysophospholipase L1-like esterase
VLNPVLKRASVLLGAVTLLAGTALSASGSATATTATEGAAPYAHYVALGDSYAAAPLVSTSSGGACLRSDLNYGNLVKTGLGITDYRDVTCSGAKTTHLSTQQYDGTPPQLDAVTADTDLVTLTMGGNDLGTSPLGVVDVIGTCLAAGVTDWLGEPCHEVYADRNFDFRTWSWVWSNDQLIAHIEATGPQLAAEVRKIHAKAPGAKVLLVGYPSVMPDDERTCFGKQPLAVGDVAYLRGILTKLNTMLAETAAANGAGYVDAATPTKGHDICSDDRWVEGLIPQSPAAPFHPNATGERATAAAILATLR